MSRMTRFTDAELLRFAADEEDPLYRECFLEILDLRRELGELIQQEIDEQYDGFQFVSPCPLPRPDQEVPVDEATVTA